MAVTNNNSGAAIANPLANTEYIYVSSEDLRNGVHKPQQDGEYYLRYGRQDMTGLLETLGYEMEVSGLEFSHAEQDRLHSTISLDESADQSGLAATASAVRYDFQATYDYGTNADDILPYLADDSNANLPKQAVQLQLYDVVRYPNGAEGIVTEATGADCVIEWLGAVPTVAPTDKIILVGNAQPEASNSGQSRNSRQINYTNNVQEFRRTHKVTARESAIETWVAYNDKTGGKQTFWYVQGITDEADRFHNEKEMSLLTGDLMTAAAANVAGFESVVKTHGVIPQVETNGLILDLGASAPTFADFEAYTVEAAANRAPRDLAMWVSQSMSNSIDAMLRDDASIANGGLVFNIFNGSEEQMAKFGFSGFEIGNYKFGKKVYDPFSDPTMLGASGHKYNNFGLIIPMGQTRTYNSLTGSSSTVPTMRLRYLDEGDGKYAEWTHGYFPKLGARTSGEKLGYVEMSSTCGIEMFGLNAFGIVKGDPA